jgi:hypothetical protein
MRKSTMFALIFGLALLIGASQVSAGNGSMFGGGFNFFQWLRDADDDGIPNGQDEDWTSPRDGSGFKSRFGFGDGNGDTNGDGSGARHEINNRFNFRYNETEGDMLRDRDQARDKIRSRLRDGSCEE